MFSCVLRNKVIVSKQLCLITFLYLNGHTKTQHIKIVMLDLYSGGA